MKQKIDEYEMKNRFTKPSIYAQKIKNAIKYAWNSRMQRLANLDEFFESEKRIMLSYYNEKVKKNKKLKVVIDQIRQI